MFPELESRFLTTGPWRQGFPGGSDSKESACQCRRPRFNPWVGKIPWRRKWQLIPIFLPGESHGQRSLVGYSPWGHKELVTTEWLTLSTRGVPPLMLLRGCHLLRTYHVLDAVAQWFVPHRSLLTPPSTAVREGRLFSPFYR